MKLAAIVGIAVAAAAMAAGAAAESGPAAGKPDAAESRRKSVVGAVGGFVVQPLPEDARSITVIDLRTAKDDAADRFAAKVASMMRLSVRTGEARDGDIVLEISGDGRNAVYFTEGKASVAGTGDAGETARLLMSALLRLLGVEGDKFGPHLMGTVLAQAKARGIGQVRRATSRTAVKEGWAPAPTNDIQRAVWEDEKARMAARKANDGGGAEAADAPAEKAE